MTCPQSIPPWGPRPRAAAPPAWGPGMGAATASVRPPQGPNTDQTGMSARGRGVGAGRGYAQGQGGAGRGVRGVPMGRGYQPHNY